MTSTRTPYPNIGDAAWTVLLRADDRSPVTEASAAQIVGPDLACEAVADLDRAHLIDDEGLSPLAMTLRRWHRAKVQP